MFLIVLVPMVSFWIEIRRGVRATQQELTATNLAASTLESLKAIPARELPLTSGEPAQIDGPVPGVRLDPPVAGLSRPATVLSTMVDQAAPGGFTRYVGIEAVTEAGEPALRVTVVVEFRRLPQDPRPSRRFALGQIRFPGP